jgi:hypothetical protein
MLFNKTAYDFLFLQDMRCRIKTRVKLILADKNDFNTQ